MKDNSDDATGGSGEIEIVVPTDDQWEQAAYLQLKPYDTSRAMLVEGDHSPFTIPLLGTIRHYAVELVFSDDTWEFLHFGTDLPEAKALIQALAARHDRPITRLFPNHSDVERY
jgi:hypothetical protein